MSAGTILMKMPTIKSPKIALYGITAYLLFTCLNLVNQEFRLQGYQTRLSEDHAKTLAENKELKEQIRYYGTSQGVEELARKRLGYYRKGEVPLRVIPAEPTSEGQKQ